MGLINIFKDLKGESTKHHRRVIVIFKRLGGYDSLFATKYSIPYGTILSDEKIYNHIYSDLNFGNKSPLFKIMQIICCEGIEAPGAHNHIIYLEEKVADVLYGPEEELL